MAKGNPNIAEYGKNTQFCGCSAVEAAKKRHEKEAVTKELMQAVADGLDIGKASQKFVQLIEKGDLNAWRLWLEYNMAKPATKIEAEVEDRTLNVIINDGSDD